MKRGVSILTIGRGAKHRVRVVLPRVLRNALAKSAVLWPTNKRCVSTVLGKTLRQRGFASSPIAALLPLSLSGCVIVGRDYKEPEVKTAPTFVGEGAQGVTRDAVTDRWWGSFKDERLEKLISIAVHSNNDLEGALARVNQSRALQQQALLDLFPTVTSKGTYTETHIPTGTFAGGAFRTGTSHIDNHYYGTGFDAFWELDIFGRVRRGLEAREADSDASVADLHDAVRILVGEVARNYFQLRGSQAQVAVAKRNAKTQEEVVRISEALYKGGQTTEFDVVRGKAQLASTLATIPPLEASAKAALYRLAVLTAQQPGAIDSSVSDVAPLPTYDGPVNVGDPAGLVKRRPDIRAAERRLAAATAAVGLAEGDLFPKVTFNGSISLQARNFGDLGAGNSDAWSLTPSITWPAFNIGRVLANVDASEARLQEALARYEQIILLSLEDLETALAQYTSARQRRDLLQESVSQSEKAVAIARVQYENGLIDLLPVLDADRALLVSQLELTQSETNLLTALVAVFKALGGGWSDEIIGTPASRPAVTEPSVT